MGLIKGGVALPHFEAVFGYTKARYRGLNRNHEWLLAALALVYLYQYRKRLAPGVEGLYRFIEGEPLRRVHECAFAVLALESEPVDPRL